MEFDIIKQRTDVMLAKKALNDLCGIMVDSVVDKTRMRQFLCPCGLVSTVEIEDKNKLIINSTACNI